MNAVDVPDFGPAKESIDWAKSDIDDYRAKFLGFFNGENQTFVRDIDPATHINHFKIKIVRSIPFSSFKKSAVGALLNLRNSFDQAINIAGEHLTERRFKRNFPWSDTLTDLNSHRLNGFPEKLKVAVAAQEPFPTGNGYPGGNNLVRAMARLSNNKHSVGFTIKPRGGILRSESITFSANVSRFTIWENNWDPVKQEIHVLSLLGGHVKFDDNTQFGLVVCFDIPELPHPPEVVFALNAFLGAAERNLELMKAACD